MTSLALSFHARYHCRHSGACCKSGWPIPVEAPAAAGIRRALDSGRLRLSPEDGQRGLEPLDVSPGLPSEFGGVTTADAAGACAFYERRSGLCAIHRQLGPQHLPSSCAHFPRVCLIDDDATYVTLSHYCPTVAGLTVEGRGSGVESGEELLAGIVVEGLDARGQLPPLLRPDMLADRPSYRAWERLVVEELAAGEGTAEARLNRLAAVTDAVAAWSPSNALTLEEHVHRCFEEGADSEASARVGVAEEEVLYEQVRACCPTALAPPPPPAGLPALLHRWIDPAWAQWSPIVGRYLAAKVFGSWAAYQGRGLRNVLAGASAALAVLRVEAALLCKEANRTLDAALLKEAMRQSDLLLVHLASPGKLISWSSR